ncbi:hypothetical protein FF125_12585 [Aureibaculum algae]|uniref:Uncharacterized protein n=1 Tax=Aureibaculum algae TaxID=2584122 RepID=A0A5B7TVB4_9FLAO|nr:hypothetical protein [Aureibaculum algae]QCX39231.1 hypothetical protein FF125_12585 [Aureibaculum algae]
MKFFSTLLNVLLLFNLEYGCAQSAFYSLDDMPNTIEVNAPEFNTEKKYSFRVDTIKNKLYIEDIRLSAEGKSHFYQWLYEIPLNHLNSSSFKVSKIDNEIKISITTVSQVNSINIYMFQDSKVSSIMTNSALILGNWIYSDALFKDLERKVNKIATELPYVDKIQIKTKNKSGTFKFVANNVTQRNVKFSDDITIGNGYNFKKFILENNSNVSNKIMLQVKKTLKNEGIEIKYPIPVIVYVSEGEVEKVYIMNNESKKYLNVDISKIRQFKKVKEPTKYLFLLDNNL